MSRADESRPCIVRPLGGARSVLHRSHSPWRDYGFWRIVHVVEGTGAYLWPGQDLDVRQSDYLVAAPGRRSIRVSKPMRLAYLPFELVNGQHRLAALAPATRFAGAGHERRVMAAAFDDAAFQLAEDLASRRAVLQIEVMLSVFEATAKGELAAVDRPPPRLHELARRIAAQPQERLSVPEMADLVGVSAPHFSRLFRQHYGVSPRQYAIRARVNAACALMEDGLSVKETAYSLSYPSPFAFSRQFSSVRGYPPSQHGVT